MAIRELSTITITPEVWAKDYKDWREQRLTENHAKKLLRDISHVENLNTNPKFRTVHSIEIKGVRYKQDGHSRSYLWKNGLLPSPNTLTLIRVRGDNMDDGRDYFAGFDSKVATRVPHDEFYGWLRDAGFEPQSGVLRKIGPAALNTILPLVEYVGRSEEYPGNKTKIREFIKTRIAIMRSLDGLLEDRKIRSGILASIVWSLYWATTRDSLENKQDLAFWDSFLRYRKGGPADTASGWYKLWLWEQKNKGKMHASYGVDMKISLAITASLAYLRNNRQLGIERQAKNLLQHIRASHGNPTGFHFRRESGEASRMAA